MRIRYMDVGAGHAHSPIPYANPLYGRGGWSRAFPQRSRPDRVENFGEPRAAPGELLALDQVHRLQIGHVVVERDGPLDPRRRLDALEAQPGKGVAREEQGFGGPGSRPGLDWTLARGQGLRIGQQLL